MVKHDKFKIDKAIEKLESSFLFWDEKTLDAFVKKAIKNWNIKGGSDMTKKGLCAKCSRDKGCDYPRKFPVNACDDFTLDKKDNLNAKE